MLVVVADSSPLIALIQTGYVNLLPALFGRVVIPPQVAFELFSSRRTQPVRDFADRPPDWLTVRAPVLPVENIPSLHDGETAAIGLALELKADLLLIDETLGRKAAAERGLSLTGTIGILERAARDGRIDLAEAFERVKRTDFWISPALLDARLRLYLSDRRP